MSDELLLTSLNQVRSVYGLRFELHERTGRWFRPREIRRQLRRLQAAGLATVSSIGMQPVWQITVRGFVAAFSLGLRRVIA